MRLIDADAFNDWILSHFAEPQSELILTLQRFIAEQPTAYSVDNVVKELEEIRAKKTCNKEKCDSKELCRICVVDDAIEIVKHGGVADDVCEWEIVDRPHNLPIYNTSCGKIRLQYATGIDIYCNGCGKKIKVVK